MNPETPRSGITTPETAADRSGADCGASNGPLGAIADVLRHREKHGRHLHHRNCVHNLPPEEQIAMRGRSVEWWMAIVGTMPQQITPDEWECEPPWEPAP